ncbi:hypothetical protein ACFE04_022774 [Oxalis oulophora]
MDPYRHRPKLDRRNAKKNIAYVAVDSPTSLRVTRSLDFPLNDNLTSFRIEGKYEGEYDLICRSLGFSGPEDFAIPTSVWEARSRSFDSHSSPSESFDSSDDKVSALNNNTDLLVHDTSRQTYNQTREDSGSVVNDDDCINPSNESPRLEKDLVDSVLAELSDRVSIITVDPNNATAGDSGAIGGIKGEQPAFLVPPPPGRLRPTIDNTSTLVPPPPVRLRPTIDNTSTAWDIVGSFAPKEDEGLINYPKDDVSALNNNSNTSIDLLLDNTTLNNRQTYNRTPKITPTIGSSGAKIRGYTENLDYAASNETREVSRSVVNDDGCINPSNVSPRLNKDLVDLVHVKLSKRVSLITVDANNATAGDSGAIGGIKGERPAFLVPPPPVRLRPTIDLVNYPKDDDVIAGVLNVVVEATGYNISPGGKLRRTVTSWQKGQLLGSGSFGTVYEGYTVDGDFFAVKEVSLLDQGSQGRQSIFQLEQEISLLSQFEHENIVQYRGTDKDESKLYIFLELVTKGSLSSLYQKYNLRDSQVSAYTRQILNGLKYLHDRNVVHRDIKCANILVDASGSVKLADFGLAKATKMNDVMSSKGSPYWMAPEVVNGKNEGYGLTADIWSLGCTVLEMLTSQHPYYPLEGMPALFRIGRGKPPDIPDSLSMDAQDFILKCLKVNPSDRPTAAQLLGHPFLKKILSTPSQSQHPSPRS